jgi:hypothetical protein
MVAAVMRMGFLAVGKCFRAGVILAGGLGAAILPG